MLVLHRLLSLSYYDSVFTGAVIVTGFFCGIAAGAYFFGKKIDTSNNEIVTFLYLQLGIGIYIILFFFIHPLSNLIYKSVFQNFGDQSFILSFYKTTFVFIFSVIPAIFIGGTFPILSRFFIRSSMSVGQAVGNLFGLNLIGVSFGYLLTTFILLQILGVKQSLIFAATLFFFNAFIVKVLLNKLGSTLSLEAEFYNQKLKHLDPINTVQSIKLGFVINLAFGISGFIALANLVLWNRSLVYIIGSNSYSFSIVLTVFLIGLAIGSILFPRIFRTLTNLFPVFGIIQIAIGAFTVLSVLILPKLPDLNSSLSGLAEKPNSWAWLIFIYIIDVVLVCGLSSFFIGASFPIVGKTSISNFERRGYKVGIIFAINSLGAIVGILLVLFVFIPNLGIQKSILFNALFNSLIGLVILFLSTLKYGKLTKTISWFVLVVVLFVSTFFIPSNMILRLYHFDRKNDKIVYTMEGPSTTVTVHQDSLVNYLTLATNGVDIDGTSPEFLNNHAIQINLPILLHPNPDTIAIVGLGTGKCSKISKQYGIKKTYCLESHSEVIATAALFKDIDYRERSNEKLAIKHSPAYNFISHTDTRFAVIINDYRHPKYSSMAHFFTQDYFKACHRRLKPDGIIASVIPLNSISIEDFKILIRTFQSVFPATSLWYNNNWKSEIAVLIGFMKTDQFIDFSLMQQRINQHEISTSLSQARLDNVFEILDCFVMGPEVLQKATSGVRINRENRPVLEFSTSRTIDDPVTWYQKIQIFKSYREYVYPFLTNIDSTFKQRQAIKFVLDSYYRNAGDILEAISYEILNERDIALQIYRSIYIKNKSDQSAARFLDQHFNPLLITSPSTLAEYAENAKVYFQKGSYEECIACFKKVLEIDDHYVPAYFGLGLNFEILGNLDQAENMYRQALTLKPNLKEAQDRLESLVLAKKKMK
ncbi:MAG: fused MFS/spermidine synthase [Candidatus Zhuqueibacterota bacterium]